MNEPVRTPLLLRPLPVARPWGGERAHAVCDLPAPPDRDCPIGEWWIVSDRAGFSTTIGNGPLAGTPLDRVAEEHGASVLGGESAGKPFPLLVKILDAKEVLSVQVHPAETCGEHERKTESWYVLDAGEASELYLGLIEESSPGALFDDAENGRPVAPHLHTVPARPGTVAHVPGGLIHAFGADLVALEIQENSDTTFRIHDWDRKPSRTLHLEDARRAAAGSQSAILPHRRTLQETPYLREHLVGCDSYRVERLVADASLFLETEGTFDVLVPLTPGLRVTAGGETVHVPQCNAVLLPAAAGDFTVTAARGASAECLRIRLP